MPATSVTTPRPGRGAATPSTPSGSRTDVRRGVPRAVGVAAAVVGVLALVMAAWVTGIVAPRTLSDPGALTRWGVPVGKAVNNTAMAMTIGALIFAAGTTYMLRMMARPPHDHEHGPVRGQPQHAAGLMPGAAAAVTSGPELR